MENLTYSNYQQFKQVLDTVINRTVEDFVIIGYLLNQAATTDILLESGYSNVNEMAEKEYKLDASQTSRFIHIYREFGVAGMPKLQDKYKEHGVAKLGVMLTLPSFINEEISSNYSRNEINTIKREYEAEQQVSDIEVAIEHAEMKESVQYSLPQMLTKAVYQLIHDEPALYTRLYACIELEDVQEILAPMGENSYIVRIKGIGRLTIFLKNTGVALINLRDGSKEEYSWQQLYDVFKEYFAMGTDAKDSWSNVFQEPYPEEKKEEPVKAADKPVEKATKPDKNKVEKPKKESKVKVVEPRKETATNSSQLKQNAAVAEQLPGQDSILNHPEYLPEDMKEEMPEVLTGEVVDVENTANPHNDNVQQADEGIKVEYIAPVQNNDTANTIRGYKEGIRTALTIMEDKYKQEDWSSLYVKASDIAFRAKKIMELEGKNGKKSE